jgi:hypothetical protein
MSSNPYSPPESAVADRSPIEFSFTVSLIGMLVATGAAYILVLLYGNLAQWALLASGTAQENLYDAIATSTLVNAITHVINIFGAAVGGYWAAKLAPAEPLKHAALTGALILIPVGIAFLAPYEIPQPRWSLALLFVTPIPSAAAGALWWQHRSDNAT